MEISIALKKKGYNSITTKEAGMLQGTDPAQLKFAINEKRVLVTYNWIDFAKLHHQYLSKGKGHTGIIVSAQIPLGEALRRLLNLASQLSADNMINRLEYLSSWK